MLYTTALSSILVEALPGLLSLPICFLNCLSFCLQPSRPISSNGIRDDHAKKRPVVKRRFDDDDDDDEDPLAMIRSMFRYCP
jgi:hypothetical protein